MIAPAAGQVLSSTTVRMRSVRRSAVSAHGPRIPRDRHLAGSSVSRT